jgi:hypothetical protein
MIFTNKVNQLEVVASTTCTIQKLLTFLSENIKNIEELESHWNKRTHDIYIEGHNYYGCIPNLSNLKMRKRQRIAMNKMKYLDNLFMNSGNNPQQIEMEGILIQNLAQNSNYFIEEDEGENESEEDEDEELPDDMIKIGNEEFLSGNVAEKPNLTKHNTRINAKLISSSRIDPEETLGTWIKYQYK